MPFKKGHKAHNKGDTKVKANFRNKPKHHDDMEYETMDHGNMEYGEGSEYLEDLGNNFMKRWSWMD